MFYQVDEVDKVLTCSFCEKKFSDVVKLLPECGNFICGNCYEFIKEDARETVQYECKACAAKHSLPENGLPECKQLLHLLSSKPSEKPLSDQARKLKAVVKDVEEQIRTLQSFDGHEAVMTHCDKLEQEVCLAFESAVQHLNQKQKNLLQHIGEYREKCLQSWSSISTYQSENKSKQDLQILSKEIDKFSQRWKEFFTKIDVLASDADIENALGMAHQYLTRVYSFNDKLINPVFNNQMLVFNMNEEFLTGKYCIGDLQDTLRPNESAGDMKVKFTVEEKPSAVFVGHQEKVNQVIFLPDNRLASCSDDGTIIIWSLGQGSLFQLKGHVCMAIALLRNGWLASGSADSAVVIWDLNQRKKLKVLIGHTSPVVALNTLKNSYLASYSTDNTIKIWNVYLKDKNLLLNIVGHGNTHWQFQFQVLSNDHLVTVSIGANYKEGCIIRVWNPNNSKLVNSVATGFQTVSAILALLDDRIALGFLDGTLMVVDVKSGNEAVPRLIKAKAHRHKIIALAQFSNGNLVSSGDDSEQPPPPHFPAIKIWSLPDFSLVQSIATWHSDIIQSLRVSHDEKFIASGSRDKTIKLWAINK